MAAFESIALGLLGDEESPEEQAPARGKSKSEMTPPASDDDEGDDDEDEDGQRQQANPSKKADTETEDAAEEEFNPLAGADDDEDADPDAVASDEDDEKADEDPKHKQLKSDNFKLREAKRELKAKLEAREQELETLRQKLSQAPAVPMAQSISLGGVAVGTMDDIAAIESRLEEEIDFLDSRRDGYTYTNPQTSEEVEVTADQARQWLRSRQKELRRVPQVRDQLKAQERLKQEAAPVVKAKYPFVTNPALGHHKAANELAEQYPELTGHPQRELAVGRMLIGKLWESGDYVLVKRSAPKAAAATNGNSTTSATQRKTSPAPASGGTNGRTHLNGHSQHGDPQEVAQRLMNGDQRTMEEMALAMLGN